MRSPKPNKIQTTHGVAALISRTAHEDFGVAALQYISDISRIENFGAYYIDDLARPAPVLSYWSGRISDYWFQKDAALIIGSAQNHQRIVAQMQEAPAGRVHIERWHPKDDPARQAIYARNGIIERIAVSSQEGRSGLRSFYLRSSKDGWLSDTEYAGLCAVLPVVHGLIGVRTRIVGTQAHQAKRGSDATRLRESYAPGFAALSVREAQVCDLVIDGKSVAATALELEVSEATVRTLRQRAYRKLKVGSATELMGLLLRAKPAGGITT